MIKGTARLTFSRYSGHNCGWHLSIQDEASSQMVLEIDMDDSKFGRLMGNCSVVARAEFYQSEHLGKKMETKRVWMPWDSYPTTHGFSNLIEAAKAAYEWDGWELDVPSKFNHHYWKNGKYEFVVHRWVEPVKEL